MQYNICIPGARTALPSNSNVISSTAFRMSKLYVQVAKIYIIFSHSCICKIIGFVYKPVVVFLQTFVWSMHRTEAVLTQLTGFNPPLFISKHQAVKHHLLLSILDSMNL